MEVVVISVSVLVLIGIGVPLAVFYQGRYSPAATLRRRVAVLGGGEVAREREDTTGIGTKNRQKLIQGKIKELEKQRSRGKTNSLTHLLLQSGLDLKVPHYIIICVAVGFVIWLFLFFSEIVSTPVSFLGGAAGGFVLPRFFLKSTIKRRAKAFTSFFADALDILVRGTRTGLPVGECLRIVAREIPDPVGPEFFNLVEGQRLGMTLPQALERGLERMNNTEYKFFAVVLLIQQETGGNLASTLDNLANVLRERRRLRDKVTAMSQEAKASAAIIASLPFLVGSALYLVSPKFISLLFTTVTGHYMLGGGLFWMLLGVLVMKGMINFKM
ncbi:tight adherence protein B [uncultured Gammaproteobacteria bacterium]